MKVAVLGSSGGMGGFFARYFLSRGLSVVGSDTKRRMIRNPRFSFVASNSRAVDGAEVVIVATPIDSTVETVTEVAGALEPGAVVVEMMSVKGKVIGTLGKITRERGAKLLSIHPLFGPSLGSRAKMRIGVIRTDGTAVERARELFPEAELIPMGSLEHDRLMAVILSLTHLVNVAFAGTAARYLEPAEFRRLQTPTSAAQLTIAESVLSHSPSLYSYIQVENGSSFEVVGAMIEELVALQGLVKAKDRKGFEKRFTELSRAYAGDSSAAVEFVYRSFEGSSP